MVRQKIVATEQREFGRDDLAYLSRQSGMFSLLPLTEAQETRLTKEHGIHVVKGGRVNVARLGDNDVSQFIRAIHEVTR